MGLGAEDGGWVLVLVESPDLGVLGWVLGNKGEDGFGEGGGGGGGGGGGNKADRVLVWGVRRVGWKCYVMECGVKSLFWGVLSNGVCRDIEGV